MTKIFSKFNWKAQALGDHAIQFYVPEKMDAMSITSGRYLVIDFKGSIPDFIKFWQNIHSSWLPNSKFELEDRPHFEKLPPSYNPMLPINEEEIWIPIK
mgnify:CR=1 FL=1